MSMRNIKGTYTFEARWLVLLVAAPWQKDTAMINDLAAMEKSLRSRGIPDEQILTIHGTLNRKLLFSFLKKARQRIVEFNSSHLFLYYSGHGFFSGTNTSNARPGLWLAHDTKNETDGMVFWDEVFSVLNLAIVSNLVLLPEC